MLKKSLDQFGDLGCVVFNQESGQLVGGHQRNKTFQPDIDITITQAYDPPSRTGTVAEGYFIVAGEKFKYREVKWDPYTEAAAMISANKQGGDWEVVQLSELIAELDNIEYDLDLIGYSSHEIDELSYEPPSESISKDDQTGESLYTAKIETPIYEPKGEKPQLNELYDLAKSTKLLKEVEKWKPNLKELVYKFVSSSFTVNTISSS